MTMGPNPFSKMEPAFLRIHDVMILTCVVMGDKHGTI
jgi:hypothetical protein